MSVCVYLFTRHVLFPRVWSWFIGLYGMLFLLGKQEARLLTPLKLFKGYGKTVGVSKHPFLSDPSSVSNIVFIAFMTAWF